MARHAVLSAAAESGDETWRVTFDAGYGEKRSVATKYVFGSAMFCFYVLSSMFIYVVLLLMRYEFVSLS